MTRQDLVETARDLLASHSETGRFRRHMLMPPSGAKYLGVR